MIAQANNNVSNSPITHDGDENEESTQGDNDVFCDDNEDNDKASLILAHSVRSSPSMSVSDEASPSNKLLTPTSLSLTLHVPGSNRLYIDSIDISERFYSMQQYVYNFVEANNFLTLESTVHLILSLSSILLLQTNKRLYKEMIPFFGNKVYQKVRESVIDSLNMAYKFPGETLLGIIETAQSVYNKTNNRINAAASLLSLADTVDNSADKKTHCIRISASPISAYGSNIFRHK